MIVPASDGAPAADLLDTGAAGAAALKGGVLRALGYAGGLALALVSAPLVIRHLGDAEYGRYAAVLAVITIVTGLTEGGVNTVALRELSARSEGPERNEVMRDLLGLRLLLSVAGTALAVAFSAIAGYGGSLVLGTLLAGLAMLAAVLQTLLAAVLQSRLRFGWATAVDLLRQVVFVVLLAVLVLAGGDTVDFLAAAIPSSLVALGATLVLVRGTISLRPAFHPARSLRLLRETAVFAVAVAVNTLYFRVTLVLMSVVATAAETGQFAVSLRVIEVLIGVPALLLGAAFPIISRTVRSDRERFDRTVARMFDLALMSGVLVAVGLVLIAPFAIEVLTGDGDSPSTAVLQIQGVGMFATFLAAATGYPLLSLHRNRETLLANVLSLIAAAGLTLALAHGLGAKGAAIAAVAAEFLLAATNTAGLIRKDGPPVPLGSLPVIVGLGALSLGIGYVVGVHPVLQAACGSAAFVVLLALTGRFPDEVREVLTRKPGARD